MEIGISLSRIRFADHYTAMIGQSVGRSINMTVILFIHATAPHKTCSCSWVPNVSSFKFKASKWTEFNGPLRKIDKNAEQIWQTTEHEVNAGLLKEIQVRQKHLFWNEITF
jgi:hypothetical protein